MNISKQFGARVRELRQQQELSQEKLAELANLHRTYISSVELGHRNVSLKNIEGLAKALQVTIPQLFESGALQTKMQHKPKRKIK